MKLYLSSYRIGNKKSFLKKWIIENGNNITVIPNALDEIDNEDKIKDLIIDRCSDLNELGFKIEILDLKDYFNKKEKLFNFLKSRKSFYVLGGNVFVLNRAMKLSGFDSFLLNKRDDGSILYSGFSAGICVLSQNLEGLDIVVDPEYDPYYSDIMTMNGIGLLDYLPIPHYKSNHPSSLLIDDVVEYMNKNHLSYKLLRDGDVIIEST